MFWADMFDHYISGVFVGRPMTSSISQELSENSRKTLLRERDDPRATLWVGIVKAISILISDCDPQGPRSKHNSKMCMLILFIICKIMTSMIENLIVKKPNIDECNESIHVRILSYLPVALQ